MPEELAAREGEVGDAAADAAADPAQPVSPENQIAVVQLGPDASGQESEQAQVHVSDWAGEQGAMAAPASASERAGSVWIETADVLALSATTCTPADFSALLGVLQADQPLTIVHEQEDFITEWNEVSGDGRSWGRIRRYDDCIVNPDPDGSICYEDSLACDAAQPASEIGAAAAGMSTVRPLVSTFSVQESITAAAADSWQRVVGVVRYDGVSFAIVQEWDGQGCIVALGGGEFKTQFMVEAAMGFSSAMWRSSHDMWLSARYSAFRRRYATWNSPTVEAGPLASSFHASMAEALGRMGYAELGTTLVAQLMRIKQGFAAGGNGEQLVSDAKSSMNSR